MAGARVGSRRRSGGGAWAEAVRPGEEPPTPPLRMRGNASWMVVKILEDKEKIKKRCCYYSRLTLKFSIFQFHSYNQPEPQLPGLRVPRALRPPASPLTTMEPLHSAASDSSPWPPRGQFPRGRLWGAGPGASGAGDRQEAGVDWPGSQRSARPAGLRSRRPPEPVHLKPPFPFSDPCWV